ncbi:DNRLRE domain-containing protein [candidate division KSB1 bacterium]|nr:DNRLRE domain-containing protein [candidate division KSB1 bacterium]
MKKILALIVIIISFFRCTNNKPLPNGYELLDLDNQSELAPPITLRPTHVGCYWSCQPAGDKSTLLLGSGKDAQSFVVFQCRNLNKVDSAATVVSAKLAMRSSFHVGEESALTVTAHQVIDEWDESTVLWQDIEDSYIVEPVETFEFTPRDTTWQIIPIANVAFIEEWIQDSYRSTTEIYGLLLKFDRARGGAVFYSSEATVYTPYVEIVTQREQVGLDTTYAYFSHDASLVQNQTNSPAETLERDPATLRVGNGTGYKSLLQFDLSQIPREATIHQALLTLAIDQAEIYMPGESFGETFSVAAHAVAADSLWEPTAIKIDSSRSAAVDVAAGGSEAFAFDSKSPVQNMSRIVQRWVSEITPNYGMLIYPYNQNSDFQEMAFMSGVTDTSSAPTLKITYSLLPAHRFAHP